MITRLDIANFKSFAGPKQLDFAPITLVYGPNSAGKSSLIQALVLLKQTLPPSTFAYRQEPPLILRGDYVDLGSFLTTVHGHDRANGLTVGLEFTDPTPDRELGVLSGTPIYAGLEFGLTADDGVARQRRAILGDQNHQVAFARQRDGSFVLQDSLASEKFERLIDARIALCAESGDPDAPRQVHSLSVMRDEVARRLQDGHRPMFMPGGFFPATPTPGFIEVNHLLDLEFGIWFEQYLYSRARIVTEILDGLAYLGPLRSMPTRYQALASATWADVGLTGEHTTRLLADQEELVSDLNRWLEKLRINYSLSVIPVGVPSETLDGVARVEIGDLVATRLVHTKSKIAVTPQDVGFGISQLLPVIVQLLVNTRSTICIEQPEVHIHPRLQAEVADLVIESIDRSARANQVVIETHSESLILRIQRRVAEGVLDPEDVAVLYVDDADGIAAPTNLSLDQYGAFTEPWPGGFFTERDDDLFAGSAKRLPKARRRSDLTDGLTDLYD